MVKNETGEAIRSLHIQRDVFIEAAIEATFRAVVDELGEESRMPGDVAFPMKIELWPGGRWYRDLGNRAGHFWGTVQVVKPPRLLEISGPMFMSYPAVNFVRYRLAAEGSGTRLTLTHRAMGLMPDDDIEGVESGWDYGIERIRELAGRGSG
ncbi:MAG: SRPBCC domain-containing protein [Phycisphaeraceae bacterium]|nr:SRPBCC domain-containing protein [Phycisphaerae bacterium]MBX3392988.1 SRPBCC domain-containing protein [Phycisphaeraceae bacterium]HRJ50725.1 SRPBCC domain-containing protein [Phycisphaerales bacterium]